MSDLFEGQTRNIPITKPADLQRLGEVFGLARAAAALDDVPKASRGPGFALAEAIMARELAEQRAKMIRQHFTLAAAAGVDLARVKQMTIEGTSLGVTLYADGEQED